MLFEKCNQHFSVIQSTYNYEIILLYRVRSGYNATTVKQLRVKYFGNTKKYIMKISSHYGFTFLSKQKTFVIFFVNKVV